MSTTRPRRRRPRTPRADSPAPAGDKLATVRDLCAFTDRLAGTDAERRAANAMATRLRRLGRKTEVESIYVHPQAPLIWALHTGLAFVGSLLAISIPPAGFAVVLVASTSLYLDLNTQRHLLRFPFFRRASQNVVSRGSKPDAPARLLLVAHLDAARTGLIFGSRGLAKRVAGFLPFPHTRILFWSAAVLLPILGARMAGIDTDGLSIVQLVPTLVLLVATFLLVEWQLSKVVPGANDNASGVAVAMSLAEELRERPAKHLDTWVVLTGAEESGMGGMRQFARRHRDEFERESTYVVVIDSVGKGEVRYTVSEGMTLSYDMDRRLVQLCDAIAEADREGESRYDAKPIRHGFATDALAARVSKMRTTAITCLEPGEVTPANYHRPTDTPEAIDPEALDRAEAFTLDLIRALDRDAGRA